MLLEGYTKEIFRSECNFSFQPLHCIAHLDQDVAEALPWLNAELGSFEYFRDPPAGDVYPIHQKTVVLQSGKKDTP